jgi:hypothetical protein
MLSFDWKGDRSGSLHFPLPPAAAITAMSGGFHLLFFFIRTLEFILDKKAWLSS